MDHIFHYDEAWEQWKNVVFDVISSFIGKTSRAGASSRTLEGRIAYLSLIDHATGFLPYHSDLTKGLAFKVAKDCLGREVAGLSRKILGDERTDFLIQNLDAEEEKVDQAMLNQTISTLDTFRLLVETERLHPGTFRAERRQLLLGWHLFRNKEIVDSLGGLRRDNGELIGQALIRTGVITEAQLERALQSQGADLEQVRENFKNHIFESFVGDEEIDRSSFT
jgi:hypothetical protein